MRLSRPIVHPISQFGNVVSSLSRSFAPLVCLPRSGVTPRTRLVAIDVRFRQTARDTSLEFNAHVLPPPPLFSGTSFLAAERGEPSGVSICTRCRPLQIANRKPDFDDIDSAATQNIHCERKKKKKGHCTLISVVFLAALSTRQRERKFSADLFYSAYITSTAAY